MNLEFKRIIRGYEPESVERVWQEMEKHLSEANSANKELHLQLSNLRSQNKELSERIHAYEKIESDLRDALISTQRIANQVKEDAEQDSAVLISKALAEADQLVTTSRHEAALREAEFAEFFRSRELVKDQLDLEISELTVHKLALEQHVKTAYEGLLDIQEALAIQVPSTE